ncbi:MAG TPA: hypothetical protein VMX38_02575 [Verrucomicrobiae bacterium]|jgi:hypothetical protein|nr:hypothetical protein [Verrucomicrobiae bacterium]
MNDPVSASQDPGPTPASSSPAPETSGLHPDEPVTRRSQIWMHRVSVLLFVLVSAVAGVLLVLLPWTPEWTDNNLLFSFPLLHTIVSSGFFRGICSGLGLLDIWIGFWEALHYHEMQ